MNDYLTTPAGDVQRSPISRDHPTAVWVSLLKHDAPLRSQAGGRPYEPPSDATHVIVEDWRAADRLIGASLRQPRYGGAASQMVQFLRDAS